MSKKAGVGTIKGVGEKNGETLRKKSEFTQWMT